MSHSPGGEDVEGGLGRQTPPNPPSTSFPLTTRRGAAAGTASCLFFDTLIKAERG